MHTDAHGSNGSSDSSVFIRVDLGFDSEWQARPNGLAAYNGNMWRDPGLHPLSHQHQHGLALSVLIDRGLKGDASEKTAADLAQKVAATWAVELQYHFRVEEEVVFPTVEPVLASPTIVRELVEQHREMEELIGRIGAASGTGRVDLLREFGQLLSKHIRIEERQLFEEIQARLSKEEMAALGKRIDENVSKVCPSTGRLPWEEPGAGTPRG